MTSANRYLAAILIVCGTQLSQCTLNKVKSKDTQKGGNLPVEAQAPTDGKLDATKAQEPSSGPVKVFSKKNGTSHVSAAPALKAVAKTATEDEIAAAVNTYLDTHVANFPFAGDVKCRLDVKRMLENARGERSIWFTQNCNQIPVDVRSILALFDANGLLTSLSFEQLGLTSFATQPEILATEAVKRLVAFAKIPELEKVVDKISEKVLVLLPNKAGGADLVWRVAIKEISKEFKYKGSTEPFVGWISASGPNKGNVLRIIGDAQPLARIRVFNAKPLPIMPNVTLKGFHVLTDNEHGPDLKLLPAADREKHVPSAARKLSKNLEAVRSYFKTRFDRDGFDGKGGEIDGVVEAGNMNFFYLQGIRFNAYWTDASRLLVFGAGGPELGGFESALDVVGHELTHAVQSYTSNLAYEGESGALNEHFADVFGEAIQRVAEPQSVPFMLGELSGTLLEGKPLRNMENPSMGALGGQPAHMNEYPEKFKNCTASGDNDNCGVHSLSGIPNRFAASAIKKIGWEKMENLLYTVMTERMRSDADFLEYKQQTLVECAESLSSEECVKVKDSFEEVGL